MNTDYARNVCLCMKRIRMSAKLMQMKAVRMMTSHLKVAEGAVFCLIADFDFWDRVAIAMLSFKSALTTDFSSLSSVKCSP